MATREQFSEKATLTGSNVVNIKDSGGSAIYNSSAMSDGNSGASLAVGGYGFNGTNWDRVRNNTQGTLLASAARAVSTVSPIQTNYNGKGVKLFLKVTNSSGSGGLTVRLESIDPVSGDYAVELTAPAAIIANGLYEYDLYPGVATAGNASPNAVNQRVQGILGRTWQARVNHGDGSSYTYSVGYSLIL